MALKKNKNVALTDPADIALVYEEHRSELRGFISKRVNTIEEAEDILQNVFYSLVRIDLIENPIEHISSWLYRVARNQIIDRRRKHREEPMPTMRSDSDDDDLSLDLSMLIAATDGDPESNYIRSLVWEELIAALDELPPEQKSIFELTEMQDFTFREISESTGIPINTLLSRKRYAVLYLRERLRDVYQEITA